VSFESLTEGG